jgi:hypothetical protein
MMRAVIASLLLLAHAGSAFPCDRKQSSESVTKLMADGVFLFGQSKSGEVNVQIHEDYWAALSEAKRAQLAADMRCAILDQHSTAAVVFVSRKSGKLLASFPK